MNNQLTFILKVFISSLVFSFIIKYGGDLLPINDNTPIALYSLISITLPSLILAIALWKRSLSNI